MDPFIGEIMLVPYNFAPRGWAFCDGAIISIAQNTALFALLGTTYGGNGQTTFALPDLRGRVALGRGQGPGLSNYDLGQEAGLETITLALPEIPAHVHQLNVSSATGTSADPTGRLPAQTTASVGNLYGSAPSGTLAPDTVTPVGAGQPHNNMQPYLVLNYIIALEGIFPSRP